MIKIFSCFHSPVCIWVVGGVGGILAVSSVQWELWTSNATVLLTRGETRKAHVAVEHASPSSCCSLPKVCMGIIPVLLLAQRDALCSNSNLSSSQIFALLKSDLGNPTQSQMLLFVPLQGFPSPTRNAGSCRVLYSAVTEILLAPVALTCGARVG